MKKETEKKNDDFKRSKTSIPVLQENVTVTKKTIEKAKVKLSKKINTHSEFYELPLTQEEIEVKRISKNEILDNTPPGIRYEGDIMIIPVLKEVAVIEKKIMLVEEIHVSKYKYNKTETREVVLRNEEIKVERTEIIPPAENL